jgi:hypothetical protein
MKITCKAKVLWRGVAGAMLLMFVTLPVSAEGVMSSTPDGASLSTSSEVLAAVSLYKTYTPNAVDVVVSDSISTMYDSSGNPMSTEANKPHMVQGANEASPSFALTLLLAVIISLVPLSRRH